MEQTSKEQAAGRHGETIYGFPDIEEFRALTRKNGFQLRKLMTYYRCVMMEIETKFRVLNEQLSLEYDRNPIEAIKTRLKSWESVYRKMKMKNVPLTVESLEENLSDIAGIRVICSFPEDIYALMESFLRQDDVRLLEKKDYIMSPKSNGYRSLHLIVEVPIFLQNETRIMKAEVQFRTIAMDFWASLEHKLRYKKNIPEEEAEMIAAELLECSRLSVDLDSRMQSIRNMIQEPLNVNRTSSTRRERE